MAGKVLSPQEKRIEENHGKVSFAKGSRLGQRSQWGSPHCGKGSNKTIAGAGHRFSGASVVSLAYGGTKRRVCIAGRFP